MRLRDENKRRMILSSAAKLFSEQPFHKVRLDDVAEAASVGKGTVYIYFSSKEDLYFSLVYDSFADAVKRISEKLDGKDLNFSDKMRVVVDVFVDFALQTPQIFEVMRTAGVPDRTTLWDAKRQELCGLIEQTIRQGIAAGELTDIRPDYTAVYIPSMVRALMSYVPKEAIDGAIFRQHMSSFILNGILKERTQ
jgi:AcrR family transcriptional regulator